MKIRAYIPEQSEIDYTLEVISHEKDVLEYIHYGKLVVHAEQLLKDNLMTYDEFKPIACKFQEMEQHINDLHCFSTVDDDFSMYYWDLYED